MTGSKVNILIVDDNPHNLFVLEQILSNPERNIINASTGKEALTFVLNKEIDLIILDVQMPEMDGFEVAQILKSNKRTKEIPIIFASAEKKEHEFMMKGYEEGAIDYLYKPLNKEITEAKVSVLIKLYMQKKELAEKNFILEKYALLINNSADIICIINPHTFKFEEVNNAITAMLGYTIDEVKNSSLLSYTPEEFRFTLQELYKDNRDNFSFETEIYAKDRSVKCLHWNIVNKNGLWFANARDTTEEKEAKQEIKQLNLGLKKNLVELEVTNKELESFSYSVSHDLRAPLRAVNGFAKMLEEDYKEVIDSEGNRLIKIIQDNARNMGALIDDLLNFSKLGKKELHRSLVNMKELVEFSLNEINNNTSHKASVKIGELHPVMADGFLMKQVILNLLSNGIKYSSKTENPQVEIQSEKKDGMIIYSVRDNGAGFDMKYIDKLFGVFQRLHSANEFEGTGVGLALVQRIIGKHGGKVWAEGKLNEGAVFYFALPSE